MSLSSFLYPFSFHADCSLADPSLPSHPSHELAKTMLPRGSGGMVSFGVKGDDPGALGRAMIDALGPNAVPKHCANVGVGRHSLFAHLDEARR